LIREINESFAVHAECGSRLAGDAIAVGGVVGCVGAASVGVVDFVGVS